MWPPVVFRLFTPHLNSNTHIHTTYTRKDTSQNVPWTTFTFWPKEKSLPNCERAKVWVTDCWKTGRAANYFTNGTLALYILRAGDLENWMIELTSWVIGCERQNQTPHRTSIGHTQLIHLFITNFTCVSFSSHHQTVTSLHLTIGLLCVLSTCRIIFASASINSHSSSVHGLPCVRRLNQLYCPTAGKNYPR